MRVFLAGVLVLLLLASASIAQDQPGISNSLLTVRPPQTASMLKPLKSIPIKPAMALSSPGPDRPGEQQAVFLLRQAPRRKLQKSP